MNLNTIKADKAAALTEMRAALNAGNTADFDKLAKQVEKLDETIRAEERMAAYERPSPVGDTVESEIRNYSVSKAIIGYVNGKLEGREAEVAQELARGASQTRGMRIPLSAIADYERRDVLANAAFQDKNFQNLIPRLAPASRVIAAGATSFPALAMAASVSRE